MNWFDILTLSIVGISAGFAFFKGFIREVIALGGFILATVLAFLYYEETSVLFKNMITVQNVRSFAAFVLIFFTVIVLVAVISYVVKKVFYSAGLSFYDKMLGLLFGVLRGMALMYIIILALNIFSVTNDAVKNSKSYFVVLKTYSTISGFFPDKKDS